TGRRKGVRLGEAHVGERVVRAVRGADEHDVGRAGTELLDGQVNRGQGGGTGGVDGEVRAVQVQLTGDAAGDDVDQEAGERVLGPVGQRLLHLGDDLVAGVGVDVGLAEVVVHHGPHAQAGAHLVRTGGGEDDAGLFTGELALVVAGVGHRAGRDLEREQLQ